MKRKITPWYNTLGKEQLLHSSVCDYLDYEYPHIFYFHPHNEARRTPYERFLIKVMRLRPGLPDILVPIPKKGRTGMALEFKIKPNKLTENQIHIIDIFNSYNWKVNVCYDFDEAKIYIDQYLKKTD
ncbi:MULTISPECIES: VRR-NUC domain-containing protein [Blattabacterium]|uniref:VRR-NUC domain-containing protein n=1 Tax=Blattabacterium TaxID=34098 RepID=UPI000303A508|nr:MULTISPECIES: VRR-NUC domain-containing protein [Blattabacterium]AWU44048.1 VRR-NUC domain-containing protein [Blattabacterium sp. (Cryptocercus kyebangensis)]AWU44591.1 VRR-NUC domain-containing protein [Blattabacterium punctulatus]AWU45676.1 VRR-NUC domain-containing protein [Blattabacterium punctulatus]